MPRAAIDIGSNSILLLVLDDDGAVLHDEATVVGLGRGLGDRGLFAPDRMKAAEGVLKAYVATARKFGVDPHRIKAVATSAARRAHNAPTWLARVLRRLSLRVQIITGEEEARLTWLGALRDLSIPSGPILVVDLGGGSTELVLGEGTHIAMRVSLEVGSVRLMEAFLGTERVEPAALMQARNHVESQFASVVLDPQPRAVIGVAGTVTTLATMGLGLTSWDADAVHGTQLSRSDLASASDALLAAGPAERRALAPCAPDRADYLLAGAAILDRALFAARRQAMIVSDRGLRFGVLG
jgi:exopolyphosphatase/guanosine-5'-triphosphate,3'-diphosphate pyrophosphatase